MGVHGVLHDVHRRRQNRRSSCHLLSSTLCQCWWYQDTAIFWNLHLQLQLQTLQFLQDDIVSLMLSLS